MSPRPLALAFALLAAVVRAAAPAGPVAHAHNDYEHARPLHDALARGFGSVEADIWLVLIRCGNACAPPAGGCSPGGTGSRCWST